MRPLLSAFVASCCLLGVSTAYARQVQPSPAGVSEAASASTTPPQPKVDNQVTPPAPVADTNLSGATQTTPTPAGTDQQQTPDPSTKDAAKNEAAPGPPDDTTVVALDANGKPVDLPPCARKDKECVKKRKVLLHHKEVGMKVENGTLTVDGWTGKARLNYDIHEVRFLYISIPGVGTVVASMQQFPNSIQQKDALAGNTLTLKTPDDHTVQVSSDENLVDKKEHPFFVLLDKTYVQPGKFPSMGYGTIAQAPYNWPGVRPMNANEQKRSAAAPPLPSGLLAKQVQLPCQRLGPGEKPTPVKVNGIVMTPEACKSSASATASPSRGTAGFGAASPAATVATAADPAIKN